MSVEGPLYDRDPNAWYAHIAEGNARQARKRVCADVLIRDTAGRMLLVDPRYKPGWDLPGGMAEANEPPHMTARREVHEELGIDLELGRLLCVDWVAPHGPWDDLLAFVFDGGRLVADRVDRIRLQDEELAAFDFCDDELARDRLPPSMSRRVAAASSALSSGEVQYLHDGRTTR
ncbi:NUDIX domain-containing protein [Jiangella alkaliphila]|uniref:ADP-ribose pyrophosphatase YjhB, NUDIX family n=1 Tax=Jiangella alkaliphila TaxID=419479 RepID=A0A1H2IW22_9ACTN|nr:NUDIX hydrolase [Jiangella alkaliphila]SDU48349.1 ADP-ribose pyrophosphatase YjhB, NUDIX family [Jiangella alkaliphila]